jgi:hypothetical protein
VNEELPRGIYFEEERCRYRVRLYRRSHVVWRTYHFHLEDALEALSSALEAQAAWRPQDQTKKVRPIPQKIMDLFQ